MLQSTINDTEILTQGNPRFADAELNELARREGLVAAWRRGFQRLGPRVLEKVTGNFSVAIREPDGRVFMAVDHFAVHSLCYGLTGSRLDFSDRADRLAQNDTEIDPQAIFDYFHFHSIPSPRTIFRDIWRIPPAHYVLYEKGQLTVTPYWTPSFEDAPRQPLAELKEEFKAILHRAVKRQLDDGKAGCFLSGGTDSSTVAGMIGEVLGRPAATYSIGFEADGYDEMAYARIASKHFRTEHHEYYVTPDDLIKSIPLVAAHYDQPFGNSSALPAYYCARMAKEDGISRILAGDGGDELFGGNVRYAKQRIFNWYRHIPAVARKQILEPALGNATAARLPLIRKAASYVEQASVPMPDRLQMYNMIWRLGIDKVLTSSILSHVNLDLPLQLQRDVWKNAHTENDTNRELAYDWRFTLAESDLPKVCGTTELAGLAVGFPMLDDDLLAFSLRLPIDYKLKGLRLRWFFKEALRGFLPEEIILKKKQGFGLPFGVWLTRNSALLQMASESVHGLSDRGILRSDFLQSLFDKHLYEHPGYYGEMIWISMMLEQWLRKHKPSYQL